MLAAATGADYGVAVSAVDPEGPAAGALRPGDVITAIGGSGRGTPGERAAPHRRRSTSPAGRVLQGLRSGRPLTAA